MVRVPGQEAGATVEAGGDSRAQVLGVHGAAGTHGMAACTAGMLVCGHSGEGARPGLLRG